MDAIAQLALLNTAKYRTLEVGHVPKALRFAKVRHVLDIVGKVSSCTITTGGFLARTRQQQGRT
jgi:hypothetical protein